MERGHAERASPDPDSLLELATRRDAEVVGLGDEVGTLALDKRADLQTVRLDSVNLAGLGGEIRQRPWPTRRAQVTSTPSW